MADATPYSKNDKAGKHPKYYENVTVVDINGYEFTIGGATVPGPIKVETSSMSHPAYNPDREVKQVSKGRLDQFAEKMKRMEAAKKN
ncbi:MAG: 50S ribosomal protein L31 [Candidatus Peribacteria bacterium]|nr:MAG: 50S ribosomal protein L31 [Candidatus Peribacteria bacterium]